MGSLPHKFPRTPHLWGSGSTRDDRVLSLAETRAFLAEPLIVEEKVDGSNLGVGFDESTGALSVQNRGHVLGRGEHAQYSPLWPFLAERHDALFEALGTARILFGEWCYARHSVAYDRLPSYFLAFDLYDKSTGTFAARAALEQLAHRAGIATVPVLDYSARLADTAAVAAMVGPSRVGSSRAEGVYLRRETNGRLSARAKYVRPDFTAGISEHWASRPVTPNRLAR